MSTRSRSAPWFGRRTPDPIFASFEPVQPDASSHGVPYLGICDTCGLPLAEHRQNVVLGIDLGATCPVVIPVSLP